MAERVDLLRVVTLRNLGAFSATLEGFYVSNQAAIEKVWVIAGFKGC